MPNGYEAPLGKGFEYPRNLVRLQVPLGARKGQIYGSAVAMVVLQRSVKPFPQGKHRRFESSHSHNLPEMVDDACSVGQLIIIKVQLKVILQTMRS